MLHNSLLLALLATATGAPLVLAAPVPMVLVPTNVDASPRAQKALSHPDPSLSQDMDNRPFAPSGTATPAVVLSTPRPLITTYLMALSAPVPALAPVPPAADAAPAVSGLNVIQLPDDVVIMTDDEVELAAVYAAAISLNANGATMMAAPCYYSKLRHEKNEMTVICIVAIFLLVVVVIEFGDVDNQAKKSTNVPAPAEGAIRLVTDQPVQFSEKQPLSVPTILTAEAH